MSKGPGKRCDYSAERAKHRPYTAELKCLRDGAPTGCAGSLVERNRPAAFPSNRAAAFIARALASDTSR